MSVKDVVRIKSIAEAFSDRVSSEGMREKINCVTLDKEGIDALFPAPVFLNAFVAMFVLSGTGTIRINYRPYPIRQGSAVLLSASHLFGFEMCSSGFRCLCLLVSREFTDEMDSTDMINRRIRYGVKLYNAPVLQLDAATVSLLADRIAAVGRAIDDAGHLYHKEVILNSLFAFYLDLSNAIDRRTAPDGEGGLTRYESMIQSFIGLLVVHYRKEHKVGFYASRLNVSAHYLTLIVRRVTGQSVCDFIFEMLYSDARKLLTASKLSVQQIAALLNFSDQSAFGKFFRRKAGVSPAEYRRRQG